jgi:hypothetical protein
MYLLKKIVQNQESATTQGKAMSEIAKRWITEECHTEDGIYFGDDTFIPLQENTPQLPRRTITELLSCEPDNWSAIMIGAPLTSSSNYLVYGGETSWEGAGFLALVRASDRSLIWLLHSSTSEPFRSASIIGDLIVAESYEYPMGYRWEIPIDAPWLLISVARDE